MMMYHMNCRTSENRQKLREHAWHQLVDMLELSKELGTADTRSNVDANAWP